MPDAPRPLAVSQDSQTSELTPARPNGAVAPNVRRSAGAQRTLGALIWRGVLVAAGLFWVGTSVYVLLAETWLVREPAGPPLTAKAAALDFGSVWNSDEFKWTVPLENASRFPIEISRLAGSCSCTAVDPPSLVIKPGEQVNAHLTYNLVFRTRSNGNGPSVPFEDTLSAFGLDDSHPIAVWHIRGTVKNAFFVKPDQMDFGDSVVEGQTHPPRRFDVTCYERCRALVASVDEHLAAAVVTSTSGDGLHFQVQVAPSPTLDLGVHKFRVALRAVLPSGEETPPISMLVEANVLQDVEVLPPLVHFGDMKLGERRAETISLASRTGRAFEIVDYKSSSKGLVVLAVNLNESPTKQFRVQLCSSKQGREDSEIRFKIRYAAPSAVSMSDTVRFDVRAYGTK